MSPPRPSDPEVTQWALAARRGDRAALDRFVRATQGDVWRFVAHLSTVGVADDLTQETYVRALGSLHRFAARSSARTWLLSIARRTVADHIRAARSRPRKADVPDWQATVERVQPTGALGFDDGVALNELITSLHPDQREAFLLTQILGLSYADAAEVCDCPIGTIRSRIARARDDLITRLRDADHHRPRRSAM